MVHGSLPLCLVYGETPAIRVLGTLLVSMEARVSDWDVHRKVLWQLDFM